MNNNNDINAKLLDACIAEKADFGLVEELVDKGADPLETFNEYGDNVYPRPENDFLFTEGSVPLPQINDACVNRLNELKAWLNAQGAEMVIAAYPIGDGEFTPAEDEYISFQQELADRLDAEVISDFTDYFYGYSLFFDSNLHLTDEGVKLRTAQLIRDLTKVIKP